MFRSCEIVVSLMEMSQAMPCLAAVFMILLPTAVTRNSLTMDTQYHVCCFLLIHNCQSVTYSVSRLPEIVGQGCHPRLNFLVDRVRDLRRRDFLVVAHSTVLSCGVISMHILWYVPVVCMCVSSGLPVLRAVQWCMCLGLETKHSLQATGNSSVACSRTYSSTGNVLLLYSEIFAGQRKYALVLWIVDKSLSYFGLPACDIVQ